VKTANGGVIGAGFWGGASHLPAVVRSPGAELLAVQKGDPARTKKAADESEDAGEVRLRAFAGQRYRFFEVRFHPPGSRRAAHLLR
jgi:predicted dehydrogenase